ncbi:MAG TPA: serine/threonine-protein kinase [Gaiellaceae bacterium]|nr:serine/threonine-protein kinase [Gaiellaceae bacterium]
MADTLIAGRYRLDELLGRGGMSEVWRATDLELDRRVALKLLAPRADVERFEREARAFAALAHPNVTQLYDYGEDGDRPYMVLEYVPGGTLEDRLQKGALPDAETHAVATDIASGLAHAHARGVVHRDVKPTNILFDEEGRAKLTDFGIAQTGEGTLTDEGTVLGTAAYISPEQASGAPTTPATDVYSFGVMLFRMLTGRPPFESADPLELVTLHRDAPAPPVEAIRPDAPPGLAALAAAALAKDPRERPQDGAALLAALDSGVASTGVTQVMPPPPPPAPTRKRSPALVVGLLLLLAIGGAAVAYAITRPDASPSTPPATTSTGTSTTLPTTSTQNTTTTAPTTSTTLPTPTLPVTTVHTTTVHTTTAPPPPTTTAPPPPTTTAPPTTTTPTTTGP